MTGEETILIENWCQQFQSHSVGTLRFGPDGALYAGAGDGASYTIADFGQRGYPDPNPCGDPPAGPGGEQEPATSQGGSLRAQNLGLAGYGRASLDGKIIRIDPLTGAAAPGNPLAGSTVPWADRIIARGLRNPFRFTFRPDSDELWIGDVGWVDYEEIDRLDVSSAALPDFGWPCFEGDAPQTAWAALDAGVCEALYATPGAVVQPWFKYHRTESVVPNDGCAMEESSLSGIAFYDGGDYPSAYDGALFFADYSRGCIWTMFPGVDGLPDAATRTTFVRQAAAPVDLEIGPGGDLFYVDIGGGTVRRVRWFAGNQPPIAAVTADRTTGPLPLTIHFDASTSRDPDDPNATALTFRWDLDGDGELDDATGPTATHTYTEFGGTTVTVEVTDADDARATTTIDVRAGDHPPVVTILAPLPPLGFKVGDVVEFSGMAVDQEDGVLPPSALTWTLILRHCPGDCHTHPIQEFEGVAGGTFDAPDHEWPSHVELTLTAVDSGGLATSVTVALEPRTVDLTFATEPPGLTIGVGATAEPAPFVRTVSVGSVNAVIASAVQTIAGVEHHFVAWSDGGDPAHDVVAGEADATIVATYARTCSDDGQCDDMNGCTADRCEAGLCAHTSRSCPAPDTCHDDGRCDAATGACVMPSLTAEGAACALRTALDGACADMPAKLRRRLERRFTRAGTQLASTASSTPRRLHRRLAAVRRVLQGASRRVTRAAVVGEPCRTRLLTVIDELLGFVDVLRGG
jgi:glucose/arabinose dehydrogenase